MAIVSLHINGTKGTCRTKVLACSASYASLRVHNGYLQSSLSILIQRHHLYGTGGTMTLTITARTAIAHWNTILPDPHGMTNLYGGLLLASNRTYGTSRAHIRTLRTLGTAISTFVRHLRLHQSGKVGRRSQHTIGAYRNTKLARSTMLGKMACAQGSGGHDVPLSLGSYLVLNSGQTAIHLHLLCLESRRCHKGSTTGQESTARIGHLFRLGCIALA